MTRSLSNKERTAIEAAISDLIETACLYRSCLTCQMFNEPKELCTLNGINQRPPARIIATGCPHYYELPPF